MVEKKTSAAQRKATERYLAGFDDLRIRVPKGEKDAIKQFSEARGMSLNTFVRNAICDAMKVKGGAVNGND